jgi:hypothetical protein
MAVVVSGYVIPNMPCPPAPRKGYTLYFNRLQFKWIYVKSLSAF